MRIPDPVETFELHMDDGARISVRRHGRAGRTRLFITHGNGFAIDGYAPFWVPLADDFDVVVFDMRNHGESPAAGADGHHYRQMARDLETIHRSVSARLGAAPSVGVFHSMSGRAAMKHAVEIGWRWDALALFDPPNVPPHGHPEHKRMARFERKLVEWALERTEQYASPDELAREYRESRAHGGWVPQAHALMANAVLRPSDGGFTLACPRELEASIYLAALTLNLWPPASAFGGPVKLIAADPEAARSPTAHANRALAAEQGYAYEAVPGTGHMLQIEKPQECVEALRRFLHDSGMEAGG